MSVSLICSCKNRIDALRVSLSSWLTHKDISEIIIVDWNSDEPIDFLLNYDDRIKIIRVPDEEYFNQPQPLNLAVDISTGDYILKVDCDYVINPYFDFVNSYKIDDHSFLCGQNDYEGGEIANSPYFKYLRGLLYISRENYLKVNGYSEINTKYYAYEDDEIVARLELLGLEKRKVKYDHNILHIPHPDKKRVENFEAYHTDKSREESIRETLSKHYSGEELEWQVQYVLAQNHIEVNRQLIGEVDDYYSYRLYKWNVEEVEDRYFHAYKKKIEYEKILKDFPRVNYISLTESVGRQKCLENQFKKFGVTDFSPLLSKRFSEENDQVLGSQVHILDDGTKGCVVSHIKMIKRWYEETDEEYGFFCEDDLSLESVQYWDFTWKDFIEKIPENIDCVQLYCIREGQKPVLFESRWQTDWSVTAYILTRNYAKKIIDQYYVSDSEFNLEVYSTGWYPMPENVLFYGHGNVYVANIFTEKISIESTFSKVNNLENGYKEYHLESYLYNLNWWRKNQYNNINKLFPNNVMESKEKIMSIENDQKTKYVNMVINIDELLSEYAVDTENAELNFKMGLWYEHNKQDAASLSYYIRAAERAEDDDLAYESLIHGAYCYDRQGTRDMTVKGILQQALCLLPHRPEAYYHLSNFCRKRCQWQDCYMYANNGLLFTTDENEKLRTDIHYPGRVGLLIEKAVAAWDWGKLEECYGIIEDLEENYTIPHEYSEILSDLVKKFEVDQWYYTDEYKEMLKKIRKKREWWGTEEKFSKIEKENITNDIGKIDIVLQGGIDDSTFEIVETYLKLDFVNKVIVSTWEDDELLIPDSEKLIIVKNIKPKSPGTDNRNLQIVSSQNGLKFVETKYSAKMRTDQKYDSESMCNMYEYMLQNREHEDQIFVAGMYPNLLFHPRDHIFWGRTCDLIELFDVPLEYDGLADKIKVTKENLYKYYPFFVRSETYIGARYCTKFDETINIMLLEPEKYLHDNSSGWSQAHQVSQNVVNRAFKSFPRGGVDLEWSRKGLQHYPYDDQKNGYGECWAEDL